MNHLLVDLENQYVSKTFVDFLDFATDRVSDMDREAVIKLIEEPFQSENQRFVACIAQVLATSSPLTREDYTFVLDLLEAKYQEAQIDSTDLEDATLFISGFHKVPGVPMNAEA